MSLMQNFLWLNNKLKFKAGTDAHILEGGGEELAGLGGGEIVCRTGKRVRWSGNGQCPPTGVCRGRPWILGASSGVHSIGSSITFTLLVSMRQDSGLREYDPRSGTPVPEIDEIENMKQNSKA